METKQATSEKNKRLIEANTLVEKFLSLTLTVTGVRFGKGIILELLNKYRNGILQLINEQPTVDPSEVVRDMWIPATERLPKQWYETDQEHWGEPVEFIVLIKDAKCATTLNFNGEDFFDQSDGEIYPVTHWMEMPDLPKAVKANGLSPDVVFIDEPKGEPPMKRCIDRHEAVCKHYPRLCKKCLSFREETNGDRVRSMSNEKLANLLGDKCVCPPSGECAETSGNCDSCWLKWLEKPAEDG